MYLSGPPSPFTRRLSPNPSRSIEHDALVLSAGFLRAFDIASVPASELFAHYFRYGSISVDLTRAVLVPLGMIFLANAMALFRAYDHDVLANPRTQVSKVVAAWAVAFAMLLVIAFFEKISVYYSRLWVGYWFCIGVSFSLGARFALSIYLDRLKRAGKLTVDIAIVGQAPFVHKVMQRLTRPNDVDVRIVGVFEPNIGGVCEGSSSQGTVDDLINFARQRRIHEIIVHLPERRDDAFYAMLQKLGELPVNVNLCPDLSDLPIPPRKFTVLREAVMINVYERPLSGWSAILKRLEDIVLSLLLLLFFLPLMAVVAVLIKCDSRGPVFFRQLRFGFNNNPISVYKFRTMYADAAKDPTAQQARRNDPRVTRVGRLLRRTSIDELPQLINVLRGDMSLVGPRPHAIAHNEYYAKLIGGYLNRHRVKPGITGWAQIHGLRGETPTAELMHERVKHDLFYIENWSLALDIWILLRTLAVGFVHTNAY